MGGSNSIRGWYDCDQPLREPGEVTLEYRFPIISVFSGELFVDAGTDFDTQKNARQAGSPARQGWFRCVRGTGVIVGTLLAPCA